MIKKILFIFLFSYSIHAFSGTVVIVGTGGTIAGYANSTVTSHYTSGKLNIQQLLKSIPGINKFPKIKTLDFFQMDSTNITTDHWLKLAKMINRILSDKEVSGVVVTHGTDTMEETAYFLNLVIKSKKPIVLVGAMRPASSISPDGPLNLYNAIAVASSADAYGKGVLVVMNDKIYDARHVTKANTTSVDAFRSVNTGPIGLVNLGKVYFSHLPLSRNTIDTPFDVSDLETLPKVEIVYSYAGMDGRLLASAIEEPNVRGIVIASMGNGSISRVEQDILSRARYKRIVVIRSSRTGSGVVTLDQFDCKSGLFPADDLTPQKARILLMLALTLTREPGVIKGYFAKF